MIKKLQKIGNSYGILLDKPLLKLLNLKEGDTVEIAPQKNGLFLKKSDVGTAYQNVKKKHRKSLDKLSTQTARQNFEKIMSEVPDIEPEDYDKL